MDTSVGFDALNDSYTNLAGILSAMNYPAQIESLEKLNERQQAGRMKDDITSQLRLRKRLWERHTHFASEVSRSFDTLTNTREYASHIRRRTLPNRQLDSIEQVGGSTGGDSPEARRTGDSRQMTMQKAASEDDPDAPDPLQLLMITNAFFMSCSIYLLINSMSIGGQYDMDKVEPLYKGVATGLLKLLPLYQAPEKVITPLLSIADRVGAFVDYDRMAAYRRQYIDDDAETEDKKRMHNDYMLLQESATCMTHMSMAYNDATRAIKSLVTAPRANPSAGR